MASMPEHAHRAAHHRQPRKQIQDPWADGGVVDQDRAEWRAADRHDTTTYRRLVGGLYDADRVPADEDTL